MDQKANSIPELLFKSVNHFCTTFGKFLKERTVDIEADSLFLRNTVKTLEFQILQIHDTVRTYLSLTSTVLIIHEELQKSIHTYIIIHTHILNLSYATFYSTENK